MSDDATPAVEPEIWLPVPGWESLYDVSSLGRVRSLDRTVMRGCRWGGQMEVPVRGRVLKASPGAYGYRVVTLCRADEQVKHAVHRLVALAFLGPRPEGMEVCHGPNGQLDNRASQLRYDTHRRNTGVDKVRDGTVLRGEQHHAAKLTAEIIAECRARVAAGETRTALAREFGVSRSAMGFAVSGKRWRHLPDIGQVTPQARGTGQQPRTTHHGVATTRGRLPA